MLLKKILNKITGNLPMLDMVFITTKINKIPNYPDLNVIVTDGSKQEHNPPHFHIMGVGLDVSISLPNYEILAVNTNKNKSIKFQGLSWSTSGQNVLKKTLISWLDMNQNEQSIFQVWNNSNATLEKAYFNFEQTKKYINTLIAKTKSKLDRDDLQEIALEHSFINKEILKQVFDNANLQ